MFLPFYALDGIFEVCNAIAEAWDLAGRQPVVILLEEEPPPAAVAA
jgi:hypothetical protein